MPKNLTEDQKRKMLAAAELVDGGDMAVMKKLLEFMDFVEEYAAKFEEFSANVDKLMTEHHTTMNEAMSGHIEAVESEMTTLKKELDERVADLYKKSDKAEIIKDLAAIKNNLQTNFSFLTEKIEMVRKEIPVLPPEVDLTSIYTQLHELESKIPTIPDIPEELGAEQIRDKLESLQDENRLSISAIHNLEERLDELQKRTLVGARGGGGFSKIAMDSHIIDDETPSGLVNGSNTIFTLANSPNPVSSLKVYVNGQRMTLTTDYTLSNKTLTFLVAPETGDIIHCDYRT